MTEATTAAELDFSGKGFKSIDEESFRTIEGGGNEEYRIFRTPSTKIDNDENTLADGQVIVAEFLGTKVMVSKEKKENWEKETIKNASGKGEVVYTNKHFVFKTADGVKFGLYRSGTLWQLEKLKTMALGQAEVNPVVRIEYVGLIPKDQLDQYKVVIETGEAAHVFKLSIGEGAELATYSKGCVNLLENPMPMHKEDNGLTGLQQDIENFAVATKALAEKNAISGSTQQSLPA